MSKNLKVALLFMLLMLLRQNVFQEKCFNKFLYSGLQKRHKRIKVSLEGASVNYCKEFYSMIIFITSVKSYEFMVVDD